MRFSILLALFVANFIAWTSFAIAEKTTVDNTVRRLKGSQLTADDEERASANFALLDDATKKLSAEKFVAKAVQNFKIGKDIRAGDAAKASILKTYGLTKQQEDKIAIMVATAAKNKVPWSKTKKIIVGVGGAALGAVGLYALYKTFLASGGLANPTD